ncbi:MAG: hypothetical protein IMZ61_00210 [Planctomycetes bacterium]|nr:hypothetical protein [Planctomycetota bacterium]
MKTPPSERSLLLLGYLCVQNLKGLPAQVSLLDRLGFSNPEIAAITGAAVQSIRNARSRKAKSRKSRQSHGKETPDAKR